MKQELFEDLISQKVLLREINSILTKQLNSMKTGQSHLEQNIYEKNRIINELREDKKILSELLKNEPYKNKTLRNIAILVVLGVSFFVSISYFQNDLFYHDSNFTPLKTKYLIQNLQGDSIDEWKPWFLVNDQVLNVNIINTDHVSQDKISAIKDAILSEETVRIDNSLPGKGQAGTVSTYYKGWEGALKSITSKTKFYIPTKFNVIESPNGEGDITINLSNLKNADGYSGYTASITGDNEILKSSITIYNADNLTPEGLGAITRHEFGHALGLGHSTDQEDLMHYVIETDYPFISGCDTDTLKNLYDGKKLTDIQCKQ